MSTHVAAGKVRVVGLGPGDPIQLMPDAERALQDADVLFGYTSYLDRVPVRAGQRRCASDNREEIHRAEQALSEAARGAVVTVVSGGDPGVFGMGAAVCEAIERGPASWRDLRVEVIPGVTAMLALAARVGAPLGHDFCAISLSDNLKPWAVIESRLKAVAAAGLVIALYNPVSRARPWQLQRAFSILAGILPSTTTVVMGWAMGRKGEQVTVTKLVETDYSNANMSTCIIIGSAETRIVERASASPLVYTPRSLRTEST